MKNKGISIFTLIFIGILLVGIGVGIGYLIPKNTNNAPKSDKPTVNTNTSTSTSTNTTYLTNTTNNITNSIINNTVLNTTEETNTLTENTIANSSNPSEIKVVEDLFKSFARAVNTKDWATVEKNSSSAIVSELKKYNVTNMLVGDDTIQENPNHNGDYMCFCSYNIDYNGLSVKDLGMGYIMNATKVNGRFVVDNFRATGP